MISGGGRQRVAVRLLEAAGEGRAHLREGGRTVGGHVQDGLPGAAEIPGPLDDQRVRPRALRTRNSRHTAALSHRMNTTRRVGYLKRQQDGLQVMHPI